MGHVQEPIRTIAAADGTELPYRLFAADPDRCRGSLVYLHGIQSHGGWYVDTAAELARRGWSTYLTDRRGSGVSTQPRGHFASRVQLVDDVRRLVDHAADAHEGLPTFVVGGCWGARPAVTYALEAQDELAGLALICPALKAKADLRPAEKVKVLAGAVRPGSRVRIPLEPEQFTRQPEWLRFIKDDPLALHDVETSFFRKQALWDRWLLRQRGLRLPLLLLQSGRDEIVDVPAVRAWFEAQAAAEKRYVLYPDFDHILDFEPERKRYWDDLAGWLDETSAARAGSRNGRAPVSA